MQKTILRLSPSKKAAFLAFMFKDAASVAGLVFLLTVFHIPVVLSLLDAGTAGLIGGSVVLFVEFIVFLALTFKVMSSYRYIFYKDYIELNKGILDKKQIKIRYDNIREIKKRQGIYQRLFGTGTINVYTAKDGKILQRSMYDKEKDPKPEMQLSYIREHERLYNILNSQLNNNPR